MPQGKTSSIFSEAELKVLKSLVDNGVEFMLVGLSAAALQGAPVVTQDVDLWVKDLGDPRFHKALKSAGITFVPSIGFNPPGLAGQGAELFDLVLNMSGLADFDQEKEHALTIDLEGIAVPVLSLSRIIASKKAANRKKDRLVVPILEDALRAAGK
ncbi:MAG: hypothetical protein D6719_04190 [Candidatus Dadabacteria bacterium]|nr:MAG: hypothetical protein D6719_04190 [Candidatus Dadabacteria bacterium]